MQRRNFIMKSVVGVFMANTLVSETFAHWPGEKPRAITNKIRKRSVKPFYIPPNESAGYNGATKIRFEQTNNQFSVFEHVIPPKTMGPPPHLHKDLDEVMTVIKGKVSVMVGDEIYKVEAGGWHMRPHGVVHTFWNESDEPAVFADIYPNQNFERFLEEFRKLRAEFAENGISIWNKQVIPKLEALHKEWGIVMYYDQLEPLKKKHGLQ